MHMGGHLEKAFLKHHLCFHEPAALAGDQSRSMPMPPTVPPGLLFHLTSP